MSTRDFDRSDFVNPLWWFEGQSKLGFALMLLGSVLVMSAVYVAVVTALSSEPYAATAAAQEARRLAAGATAAVGGTFFALAVSRQRGGIVLNALYSVFVSGAVQYAVPLTMGPGEPANGLYTASSFSYDVPAIIWAPAALAYVAVLVAWAYVSENVQIVETPAKDG